MADVSFLEILSEKIKNELKKEFRFQQNSSSLTTEKKTEVPQMPPPLSTEGALISELRTQRFVKPFANSSYKSFHRPPPPRPPHVLDAEQSLAFSFFAELGEGLVENFSLKDLKKAFRRLALKFHPDQGGNHQLFCRLQDSKKVLETLF
jgi:hypothetical protein